MFQFITHVPSGINAWSAFALSDDDQMGNDDVIACKILADNTGAIEHDYNVDADSSYPVPMSSTDPIIGITAAVIFYSNGLLQCTFTRVNSMPTVPHYRNITDPVQLLFAYGTLNSSGTLTKKHSFFLSV